MSAQQNAVPHESTCKRVENTQNASCSMHTHTAVEICPTLDALLLYTQLYTYAVF